jgi:hypothetical protein
MSLYEITPLLIVVTIIWYFYFIQAYAVVLDKEGDGATSIFAVDAQGSHVTIPSGMPLVAALLLCGAIYVVFERHRVILQVQYAPMLERHIRRVPDASDGEETSYGSI